LVAADVHPLIIPARGKFEPTHVRCHGIPNSAGQRGAPAWRTKLGDDGKLKAPNTADEKFEEVVKAAQDAAVLVLVY
jgi:hypothetical protein